MAKYEVTHTTTYEYSQQVSIAHHVARLSPRPCRNQKTLRSQVVVAPSPASREEGVDYFGNPVLYLNLSSPHTEFVVTARNIVEVSEQVLPDNETMAWEDVFDVVQADLTDAGVNAFQFCFTSPYTRHHADLRAYALKSFPPGQSVFRGARELTHRIFEDFDYDPTATDISTPIDEVFEIRAGVCQDLAHFEIACLRALGLPARYVSGYLLTHPPDGQEKLVGADASHAWLSIWIPGFGWVDFDPTNDLIPSEEHITLAWGRDYSDVSPINGVILGGGEHTVDVSVDVKPIEAG